MKIAMVGTGYVGLVTGTCFAEMGNDVTCIDVNEEKIERLKKGESVIYEPGLEELIKKNVFENRLHFSTSYEDSIPGSEVCFIAVGTPPLEDGSADVHYVLEAAKSIAKNINHFTIVVDKSTVPIGTGKKVKEIIQDFICDGSFAVVSNPEFLKEGCAINDFMRPDRIVIGTDSEIALNKMKELYAPFLNGDNRIIITDIISAEMIKYAANAMLATRISFMNEIANLCDKIGGDVKAVREGIGLDSRIGMSFLYASCGYGGSCFPKDVNELIQVGKRNNVKMKIVQAVEDVNYDQKHLMGGRIIRRLKENYSLNGKTICVWGLTFKPETDDVRESPALYLIRDLINYGAKIKCYDPKGMDNTKSYLSDLKSIEYCSDIFEALDNSDCLVIMTEWRQFKNVDFEIVKNRLKSGIIFDGRNIYNIEQMKELGFEYHCIGRGAV